MSAGVDQLISAFHSRFREAREQEQEQIAAVLHALPTDPQEAHLLLEEFEHRPDHRFDGEVLMALAQFKKHPEAVRSARARMGLDWRSLVAHPDVIARRDQDRLDELQDVLPIGKDTFEQWIERSLANELLDAETAQQIERYC